MKSLYLAWQDRGKTRRWFPIGRLDADPLSILEVSGGTRRTDNLEVFPKISKNERGEFRTRFFLRGW